MITIRHARASDQDALYEIVLRTGLSGADATHLYQDPQMLGHIYTAPYVALVPELAFVAESAGRVVGYVCGVVDTKAFEVLLETDWWPDLRARYPVPDPSQCDLWSADEARADWIHHPQTTPDYVVHSYPAHLHMNLTEAARGTGLGRQLFETWCAAAATQGVGAMHIGANPANAGGIAFWGRMGFVPLRPPAESGEPRTAWMGRAAQSDQ